LTSAPSRPAALLALVLALGVAGCGSTDAASTAAAPTTATAGPSPESLEPSVFLDGLQAAMEDTGTARFSTDGFAMTAEGAFDLGRGAVRASATIEGMPLTVIVVDGSAYLQDEQSDTWQVVPDGTVDTGAFTPEGTFAAWRAAAVSVETVGEEAIDGRPYTRYALVMDTAKVFARQDKAPPEGAPETFAYDVWADDTQLLRRVSFDVQGQRQVMDYTDWGAAVEIEAPPADRVSG
jgi:hypothetical protein